MDYPWYDTVCLTLTLTCTGSFTKTQFIAQYYDYIHRLSIMLIHNAKLFDQLHRIIPLFLLIANEDFTAKMFPFWCYRNPISKVNRHGNMSTHSSSSSSSAT